MDLPGHPFDERYPPTEDESMTSKRSERVFISLGDSERRSLAALVRRGLAEQEDGVFRLPGAAWRSFVADAY